MVTSDVSKRLASSSTLTSPCSVSMARMLWRRWGVFRFDMIIISFVSKDNEGNQNLLAEDRQAGGVKKPVGPGVLAPTGLIRLWITQVFLILTGRFQPSMLRWRARATASWDLSTSWLMVEPAAVFEPSPMVTGAINELLEPINTSSPMVVWYLLAPS